MNTALLTLYWPRCSVAISPGSLVCRVQLVQIFLKLHFLCLQILLGLLLMPPFVSVITIILSHAKPIMVGAMMS